MPVLITIATVNALFRRGSDEVSFLDPDALRERCNDVIDDTETRARAVMLAEQLQQLARQYDNAVAASVEAYISKSAKWDSSANDLIELLQPLDSARMQTVQGIVRVRQSMRELLTTEQWERVFG
jgi:uncharacterized protein YukE